MADEWYAQIDGVTSGPFEKNRLRELAAEGKVTAETPVRSGSETWTRAASVLDLFEVSKSDPAFAIPDSGSRHAIQIDPSLNDTREWRMLAETAAPPAADPARPLPRRTVEASAAGTSGPDQAAASRGTLILMGGGLAIAGVVAVVVWLLSG